LTQTRFYGSVTTSDGWQFAYPLRQPLREPMGPSPGWTACRTTRRPGGTQRQRTIAHCVKFEPRHRSVDESGSGGMADRGRRRGLGGLSSTVALGGGHHRRHRGRLEALPPMNDLDLARQHRQLRVLEEAAEDSMAAPAGAGDPRGEGNSRSGLS
jgi:hypothetical protein